MFRGYIPMTNTDAFYEAFDVKPGDKLTVSLVEHVFAAVVKK